MGKEAIKEKKIPLKAILTSQYYRDNQDNLDFLLYARKSCFTVLVLS